MLSRPRGARGHSRQSPPIRGSIRRTCQTRGIRWSARCGCGGSWIRLQSSLGLFGLAPPQAETFLASSLLAFLESNTEAEVAVTGTGGEVASLS
ncbi:MAG: hypothetical protein VXZ37_01900 [Verrucomicrobiota bacterium]|nr:hypothetical protein [Verrucomicrobiota bacterium]